MMNLPERLLVYEVYEDIYRATVHNMLWCLFCHLTWVNCLRYLCPTVMSGNSADSFSEDSEVEEEKEEVKEKAEVMVKKKGPGRPPRKRRAPAPAPVSPSIPNVHKRRCIPPKSGNQLPATSV